MPYIRDQRTGFLRNFARFLLESIEIRDFGSRGRFILSVSPIDKSHKDEKGTYTYEHACLHEDDDCEKMTTPTTLRDVGTSAKVKAAQVSYSSVRVFHG